MKPALPRLALLPLIFCAFISFTRAQDIAPPSPQKLVLHSNVLNEDRVVWVRTPIGYDRGQNRFPVLYMTDAPGEINEIGAVIDFLVDNGEMPPLIVVGIANTDRVRDLTPTHADMKHSDGSVEHYPTSGGADHFLDFIQTELMPEIDKRYRTEPLHIFTGHSLGGLLAIHILVSRPEMFQAYIASSPSLWWDDFHTLHQAQAFFTAHTELKKMLFFSLANESGQMIEGFEQLQKTLTANTPKDFRWDSAHYLDETHSTTELRAHYVGLRSIFADWQMPRDDNGTPIGGMNAIEQHYRALSERYGYQVPIPENVINGFGYRLLEGKKYDEAIGVFQRNVELFPGSANVYDSLADGYESAGKLDLALQNCQKAIEIGTRTNDQLLSDFKDHLKRLTEKVKAAEAKSAGQK
jgi:uncharacterized protein